jgi:hypothetical protein
LDAFRALQERQDAEFEARRYRQLQLALLDEPMPPSRGRYVHEHTKLWWDKIAAFDAYVFVTPTLQLQHVWYAEECHRLPLQRMEQQGSRIRQLLAAMRVAHVRWNICG